MGIQCPQWFHLWRMLPDMPLSEPLFLLEHWNQQGLVHIDRVPSTYCIWLFCRLCTKTSAQFQSQMNLLGFVQILPSFLLVSSCQGSKKDTLCNLIAIHHWNLGIPFQLNFWRSKAWFRLDKIRLPILPLCFLQILLFEQFSSMNILPSKDQ